jgi:RNA polymerase sigma factor (TIGR02999 family)
MSAGDLPPIESDADDVAAAVTVDAAFAQVYERLKAMASRRVPAHGATLQTTAVVHELYLRMQSGRDLGFATPAQFFAYAARAMRHLLCDRARDRLRLRAGGDWQRQPLDAADPQLVIDDASEAVALDDALRALERVNMRAAEVVELHYFAGLTMVQIADLLSLDRRTVQRDWAFSRAFLHARLGEDAGMSLTAVERRSPDHDQ